MIISPGNIQLQFEVRRGKVRSARATVWRSKLKCVLNDTLGIRLFIEIELVYIAVSEGVTASDAALSPRAAIT
jgi:hypothetical protein